MRSLLSRATPLDPSFSVGLGLVVILAVAEILAASFYYVGQTRAARASSQAIAATVVRPPVSAASATPVAQPEFSPRAVAPTPALSVVDQLLRDGVELRDRGDMTNALAHLQEALESEPNNAAVLEEMAKTYESMQLFDRSNAMWRKLQEMGPSAGAAYELADRRLKLGVPTPAPAEATTARKDVGGIPEGSTFGITEVKTTETPDPEAETDLTLRIGIRKQANTAIDHTKVKIQVFFYDTVNDKDIKLEKRDVN